MLFNFNAYDNMSSHIDILTLNSDFITFGMVIVI